MLPEKNKTPLVSILISSYQQRVFLNQAIESALTQTYPNIEIIIGDDGSTDGSVELIRSFSEAFPDKIMGLFHPQNIGVINNYNSLLAAATGKYVLRLDGDDLLSPENVSKQVELLEAHSHIIGCYHNLELFRSDSNETICLFIDKKRPARKGTLTNVIKYGCFFPGAFTMLRKESTPSAGYDQRAKSVSDYLYMVNTLSIGGEIMYIDEVLGRYRIHGGNLTQSRKRLILHTLWAVGIIISRYPKHIHHAIFRLFDAAKAMITKRNAWI